MSRLRENRRSRRNRGNSREEIKSRQGMDLNTWMKNVKWNIDQAKPKEKRVETNTPA